MILTYEQLSIFSREFKKLKKKYRSLPSDFKSLKQSSLELFHNPKIDFDNRGIVVMPGFSNDGVTVYKVRKFACKSLKGGAMSGLRLIYAFHHQENKVVLLEIYYKGKKSRADQDRVKQYLASLRK